ncbi:MAG: glycosyltransferase [Cyanobacteria bacterium J06649_4]
MKPVVETQTIEKSVIRRRLTSSTPAASNPQKAACRMKLLVVTPYVGETYGGTSKIVKELVSSLSHLDIDVDLVTTCADDGKTLSVPLKTWIVRNNYRVQYFPCWHRKDFIVSVSLLRWLAQHLQDYDFVHTHTLFSPLISCVHALCRYCDVPYMVTPHGMLEPWALRYKAWKKYLYFKWIEKPALQHAYSIQVTAAPEQEHVEALGFEQARLVPNGLHRSDNERLVSADIFFERFPELAGKRIILFLGRIDPKKGLDLLAPAFARAHTHHPDSHLVIAGPDSIGFMPKAKAYFVQAGCIENVTFAGMLSGDLKQAALSAADVYVAPSYSEGFSMSVLEGMASGTACVITTGCNFPEAVAADAVHAVDVDARAIGDALMKCLQDEEAAIALGKRARRFVFENYTWQQSAQKLMASYTSVL